MDALSQIQAIGPAGSSALLGGSPLLQANSAALRAAGGPADANQITELLMGQQTLLTQMLQILLMLMLGQGAGTAEAGQGGTSPVGGVGASGGSGGSSPASGAASGGSVGNPSVNSTDQGEIQGFIREAAAAYGADPNVLIEMARRESGFKTDAVNNWDSNAAKGTPSKGLFQFIEPTFNSMAPKAKAANPQAWANMGPFNWNDWRQQALVAAWAVANGQGSHWATYKAAGGR